MNDSIDPILLDTYRLLLLRPAMYLGNEEDTHVNRRRLLWIAAEMTILQRATEKFFPDKKYDGPISIMARFNSDPEKKAWIDEATRVLRRDALKKDFWKIWPLGGCAAAQEEPPANDNPMSFFKSGAAFLKEDSIEEECIHICEEDGQASDMVFEQPVEVEHHDDAFMDDSYVFESQSDQDDDKKEKNSIPLKVPGVQFERVHGDDVLLWHAEDKYKPPVRVKLTLPESDQSYVSFAHDVEITAAKTFGLRRSTREKLIKNLLAPLNGVTGLDAIKEHVETIVRLALVAQHRQRAGLKIYPLGGHMLFLGNPGTGKTHVARLLADILHKAGVLNNGQLIEVDRAALTGEYIGWSEAKTHLICSAAQGGILFIDEAYALSDSDGAHDFGYEVINVLNKRMEDDADKFIVIAAGYKDRMENFLLSNPGLRSRFHHQIEFRDYSAEEMGNIFKIFCQRYDYKLDPTAQEKLGVLLRSIKGRELSRFGNARGVRNLFEKTIAQQAMRLMDVSSVTGAAMKKIMAVDIPTANVLYDDNLAYLPTSRK